MTRILPLLLLCALPAGAYAAATAAPAAAPASAPAAAPAAHAAAPAASHAAAPTAATPAAAKSEEDKLIFAVGQLLSRSVAAFDFNDHEKQVVQAGLASGLRDPKAAASADPYLPKIQALLQERSGKVMAKTKAAGKAYRDKVTSAKNTTTTASGIVMTTLKAGTGASPKADDEVKVDYEGSLTDGTVFDSSIKRGQPATFKLTEVVPCWTEAVQLMKVGGNSRVVCPSDLAYGDRGRPPTIPGGATLVFEVHLLDIMKAPPAPAMPAAPAAPPAPAAPAASAAPAAPAAPPAPAGTP
ncbi:MAG TPA: FKBP-type peptidyl-prolyl cis-trans isomerase [Steroidobacteraceae bacterium]|nr:FKBP-type peptidyl-prolyl cis-trans isomerase [Steroidobacteraceae bacterium]